MTNIKRLILASLKVLKGLKSMDSPLKKLYTLNFDGNLYNSENACPGTNWGFRIKYFVHSVTIS